MPHGSNTPRSEWEDLKMFLGIFGDYFKRQWEWYKNIFMGKGIKEDIQQRRERMKEREQRRFERQRKKWQKPAAPGTPLQPLFPPPLGKPYLTPQIPWKSAPTEP